MFPFAILLGLIAISTLPFHIKSANTKTGVDFILVGDFGWTQNMTDPNLNFDAINAYVGNQTSTLGTIFDFIMTSGDNLYVKNETYPTDAEADLMM